MLYTPYPPFFVYIGLCDRFPMMDKREIISDKAAANRVVLKNGVPPQTARQIEHGIYAYPVNIVHQAGVAPPRPWSKLPRASRRLYWRGAWFSLPPLPAAFLSSLASLLRRFILVIS